MTANTCSGDGRKMLRRGFTPHQMESWRWFHTSYSTAQRKRKLTSRPEDLPTYIDRLYIWQNPFGRSDWNTHIRVVRRLYWAGKISATGKILPAPEWRLAR